MGITGYSPDPAAVFAAATALWQACHGAAKADRDFYLGASYNGVDELMRVVMRIGARFEAWACRHIDFGELAEVWPYHVEECFGRACLAVVKPTSLAEFDDRDCLRVALRLRLPVKVGAGLPVPVDVTAVNPRPGASAQSLRIRTMRRRVDGGQCEPFTPDDDPFDEKFGEPYFALFGAGGTGPAEHIADRRSYAGAVRQARRLEPGVGFPDAGLSPTGEAGEHVKDVPAWLAGAGCPAERMTLCLMPRRPGMVQATGRPGAITTHGPVAKA
jgi:hypothetical protein